MKRTVYKGASTSEISFPLGGIGTGSIGLAGNGRLIDWEIFGSPNKGSLNGFTHFSVRAMKNGRLVDARVLNGDIYKDLAGQYCGGTKTYSGYGYGVAAGTMAGFPHFRDCTFIGEYPLARVELADESSPLSATISAFNPYIPHNERDSSIPAAFFEICVTNNSDEPLELAVAGSLTNPRGGAKHEYFERGTVRGIFQNGAPTAADDPEHCDMVIATSADDISSQEYWYRGGWSDELVTYWSSFTKQERFSPRRYDAPNPYAGKSDHSTLCAHKSIGAHESFTVRFVISWNCPTRKDADRKETFKETPINTIRNYYSYIFGDSRDSAVYSLTEWDRLYAATKRWHDELFASTLPEVVLDAVSATSSTLKTETALRIGEKGDFWGWEGLMEKIGSCSGTCTHVWNYAYTMPFLFPKLERNLRENDYKYNLRPSGSLSFRMRLPFDRQDWGFRACVDGQMGSIIKVWREWKLCGDNEWLRSVWSGVKKSLEFAWSPDNEDRWDIDGDGVLEGRQHHTLDMELFGPSSWLEGFYLAALKAAAEMADAMGEHEDAEKYREKLEYGKKWTSENLFNGKYFIQKIDLTDKSLLEGYPDALKYWNDEAGQIKYQIGDGSIIDQLLAQWHADIIGLGDIFSPEQVDTALKNMFKNHYKTSMRELCNPWRLFSVNDDAGTVIYDCPDSCEMPAIPICYAQETMHGFEYALAGLMISRGLIDEGLTIVKAVRDHYTGENRNPWNEMECGSNYARSMASFALIPIFSGMKFDMTKGLIGFDPKINRDRFRCVWSVGGAWGNVQISEKTVIEVVDGELKLERLVLPYIDAKSVKIDGKAVGFTVKDGVILLNETVYARDVIVVK